MADKPKSDIAVSEPVAAPPAPTREPELANAAASTDHAVQFLLAQRQTAAMNDDKDTAEAVSAQLKELGYK